MVCRKAVHNSTFDFGNDNDTVAYHNLILTDLLTMCLPLCSGLRMHISYDSDRPGSEGLLLSPLNRPKH